MSQTTAYLLFGTLAALLFGAMSIYIRGLGGFLEYINRPWQSVAILSVALVVGLAAFGLAAMMLRYPTSEEIRKTPSWAETERFYRTGESPDDNKTYDQSVGIVRDDDEPKSDSRPLYNPIAPRTPGKGRVLMNAQAVWREKLEAERANALLFARQIGIAAGMLAAAAGYLLVGLSLLGKRAQEAALAAEIAASAPPRAYGEGELRFEEGAQPRESDTPQPPPRNEAIISDDAPYEPYEAPIDISELDKGHDDVRREQGK